jgi:uncharacterized membrane protein YgcG
VSPQQRAAIEQAVASAEAVSGLLFRVRIGALPEGRSSAERILAESGAAAVETVLVALDPARRSLEIVTGSRAATAVTDRTCGLASLTMTSSFAAGDLVGGLRSGLQLMADHARTPPTPHLDTV